MTEQERERATRVLAARNRCVMTVGGSSVQELTLLNTGLDLQNKLSRSNDIHGRSQGPSSQAAGETKDRSSISRTVITEYPATPNPLHIVAQIYYNERINLTYYLDCALFITR